MQLPTALLALSALLGLSDAHGFVQQLKVGNQYVTTWNPYKDPQQHLERITRSFIDNGPVTDGAYTGPTITCNTGGNTPSSLTTSIAAGSQVSFLWTPWESDHPGPVMTYMARCPGKCSAFKGDTGNVWFKIDQSGYDASFAVPWASKRLYTLNSTWTVTIPKSIANGEYILRHEILGLQRAAKSGLAQFYPACHQVTITGGGTAAPKGVALPGAYALNDPGILLEYRDISATKSYTPPGGPVYRDP